MSTRPTRSPEKKKKWEPKKKRKVERGSVLDPEGTRKDKLKLKRQAGLTVNSWIADVSASCDTPSTRV